MVHAEIRSIFKRYEDKWILKQVNLDVNRKEILAIVGPSGCGKTTLLQIVAGLIQADEGSVFLGGEILSSREKNIFVPPEKRGIGMVFQSYALWPHYTVFQNIAYPLRIKGLKKKQYEKDVKEAMEMVRLIGKEKCYPHELSGGEQQRVALARALTMNPKLLLLDESLSNLDAKLKEEMLAEIKKIQKTLGLTIMHVTHDQQEALGIADRIAVMNQGNLEQIGPVQEVYCSPSSVFVARFIRKSNIIYQNAESLPEKELWKMAAKAAQHSYYNQFNAFNDRWDVLAVHPEEIRLNRVDGTIRGRIITSIYRGNLIEYKILYSNRELTVKAMPAEVYEPGEEVFFHFLRASLIGPAPTGHLHDNEYQYQ